MTMHIFVKDSMSTLDLVRQGLHYADWLPIIQASELVSITWIFSPNHAGVLGNAIVDVLAWAAESDVRGAFTFDCSGRCARNVFCYKG